MPTYGSAPSLRTWARRGPAVTGGAGRAQGGGAIRSTVSGALTLDGEITADAVGGGQYLDFNVASGGSIYATAGTLKGTGSFSADGNAQGGSQGGGGRIAVYYAQDAGFEGFTSSAASPGPGGNTDTGEGTMGFFRIVDPSNPTTDPQRTLTVYQTFRIDYSDGQIRVQRVELSGTRVTGARLVVNPHGALDVRAT